MTVEARKDAITWFEIPTGDLDSSAKFYETVLGVTLARDTVAGIPHAIFPARGGVGGALVTRAPTQPGPRGALIYLACEDVASALARACAAGGDVVVPATLLDNIGTIAAISDLDRNIVGLHGKP